MSSSFTGIGMAIWYIIISENVEDWDFYQREGGGADVMNVCIYR